jgi:uncharacterized cupredoxin-like copper-binding protein
MRAGRVGLVIVAAVAVGGLGAVGWSAAAARPAPVEIGIRFSAFTPTTVRVAAGAPVTFVIRNDDPIDHEWIVGTDALHDRHRTGTEPVHGARPTEVTVPALESRRTTVTFASAGTYRFICHLPGHEAYGMVGTVTVVP